MERSPTRLHLQVDQTFVCKPLPKDADLESNAHMQAYPYVIEVCTVHNLHVMVVEVEVVGKGYTCFSL